MLQLIRNETIYKDDEPVQVIGWLYVYNEDGDVIGSFATIELPWKGNKNGISCIPPRPGGQVKYDIELVDSSPAFDYEHYWVKDVPGRRGIKIHRGNYYTQIEGCILVGLDHKDINEDGMVDVRSSVAALNQLIGLVGKKDEMIIKSF